MKKKRGLSLDDKRNILMQLFKKEQSFFHYKDIEKFCGKNKISFMIVKDLLAGIVADNLVETEKIGSSSFYWSLPTRVLTAKQKTLEREIEKTSQLNNELDLIEKKIIGINSSFIMFAPINEPKYSVVVLTPNVAFESDNNNYTAPINMMISKSITNYLFENY